MAQQGYTPEQLKQIAAAEHEKMRQALLYRYGLAPSALPDVYYETPEAMQAAALRASKLQQQTLQRAKASQRASTRPPARRQAAPTPAPTAPAPTQEQRERLTKLTDDVDTASKLVTQLEGLQDDEAEQRATVVKLLHEEAAKARAAGKYELATKLTLDAIHRDPSKIRSHGGKR